MTRQADSTTVRNADKAVLWITVVATCAALALSYRNQFDFATQHGGYPVWAAWAFPLMIDSFVIVGEIRLYTATYRGETGRIKAWAWALTLIGLAVSMAAGAAHAGLPAWLPAEQLAAAVAPLAAAASLGTGLGIVKLNAARKGGGASQGTAKAADPLPDAAKPSRARQPGKPGKPPADLLQLVLADKAEGRPIGRQAIVARHGVSEHHARLAAAAANNGAAPDS